MKPRHIAISSLSLLLAACGGAESTADIPENSAAVCFNPELYQGGNSFTMQSMDAQQMNINYTMPGSTDFEGKTLLQLQHKITGTSIDDDLPQHTFYYAVDKENYAFKQPAILMQLAERKAVIHNTPEQVQTFKLQPGQSFEQTITMAEANPDAQGSTIEIKRTFVGMEPITVAAGKFDTCHFRMDVKTTSADGRVQQNEAHQWVAKGSGVSVQQQEGGQTLQLINAHIGEQHFPSK
ncbi:hypothetical protein L9G74_00370 [Shewanella sp. C32]|uniref:DUF3108 domain-containing protein n=1 Tax=Shewanella electrica TaxID=515560 RepID=A0ABT2FFE9_9GAMM|nr:hypothetical protein [Shewanella electrica]MCH1925064.1 hypothetical protein [Shewanella electrica]MCS4554888.1 hypothetical protein [Shewanella electrica]